MKQSTFLNTLNWYCVEHTCFRFSYTGSASSNTSKLSEAPTWPQTHRAVLQYFASWRKDTVSNRNHFVLQFWPIFYLLFTP